MTWYDNNWHYRKPITISNSGSVLTNYQILVTIDTATLVTAGKMLSTCNDIRFTSSDSSTLLNYWIESGRNTSATKIWVKIPSILSGSTTIYLYYNNTGASVASNGQNTFLVYSDGTDVASWTNTVTNASGELHFAWGGASASTKTASISRPWIIETRFRNESTTNPNLYIMTGDGSGTGYPTHRNSGGWIDAWGTYAGKWTVGNASAPTIIYSSMALSTYYITKVICVGSANYNHYLYDTNRNILGSTIGTSYSAGGEVDPITSIQFASGSGTWSINTFMSWLFSRKYASPEPTISNIGTEETQTCNTPSANLIVLELISNQLLRQYPSYIDLAAISNLLDSCII